MMTTKAVKERRILIAGVPAAGKSHFCNWLCLNCGFDRIDVDSNADAAEGLYQLGAEVRSRAPENRLLQSVEDFVARLTTWPRLVLDWSFPPDFLSVVTLFGDAGFELWWFNADWNAARAKYGTVHGDSRIPLFDRQRDRVLPAWNEIRPAFEPNILTTLNSDGSRMQPDEIARRMNVS